MENEKEYMTLTFDDGEEIEYEVMGTIEVEDKEYIALIPESDTEAVEVYEIVNEGTDDEEILAIEDDEEFEKVIEALREAGLEITLEF